MSDPADPNNPANANDASDAFDAPRSRNAPSGSNAPRGSEAPTVAKPARQPSPRDRFEEEVARHRNSGDDDHAEEQLWSGGYSPKAMVGWWITLSLLTAAVIAAAVLIEPFTLIMAAGVILLMWLIAMANYARMRLGYQYELTSQRFIHRTGLFTRRSDRIEVIDIDDVSYQQGPVQRMFGVGNIHITSSDRSDPELSLLGIDKVSEVAGLIDDVRRTERRRRSLHIESI